MVFIIAMMMRRLCPGSGSMSKNRTKSQKNGKNTRKSDENQNNIYDRHHAEGAVFRVHI
jgi:hypothetical protein